MEPSAAASAKCWAAPHVAGGPQTAPNLAVHQPTSPPEPPLGPVLRRVLLRCTLYGCATGTFQGDDWYTDSTGATGSIILEGVYTPMKALSILTAHVA